MAVFTITGGDERVRARDLDGKGTLGDGQVRCRWGSVMEAEVPGYLSMELIVITSATTTLQGAVIWFAAFSSVNTLGRNIFASTCLFCELFDWVTFLLMT